MVTLAIDTSNQAMGIAIVKNDEVIGEYVTNIPKNHSVRLMPAIEHLMKELNVSPNELEKIVVAKGPGSYTGVRIGLTTAKTLAWVLDIPVIGVSSLEVLAYQGRFFDSFVCPFFDARRGLVYTGLYQWKDRKMDLVWGEENILLTDWLEKLAAENQKVLFLSPDFAKHEAAIYDYLSDLAIIPDGICHIIKPADLVLAASGKKADETHHLTPNYLRLAEAESNWLKMQKEQKQNG